MPDLTLGGERILHLLREVAGELERRQTAAARAELVMVGGSYMTVHGLRASTRDVDTVSVIDDRLAQAVATVGARHGLPPEWLNAHAAPWRPVGLREQDCDVLLDLSALRVLEPPADVIFLMKMNAARAPDISDLMALWPMCSFGDPTEAVNRFYEAFPHEDRDPYLVDWLHQVLGTQRQDD